MSAQWFPEGCPGQEVLTDMKNCQITPLKLVEACVEMVNAIMAGKKEWSQEALITA